jgi:excisionase family DNA binding protein
MATDAVPQTWIPVTELAKEVRVHRTTLYRAISAGLLTAHRVGHGRGVLRITPQDRDAYLAACRAAATP